MAKRDFLYCEETDTKIYQNDVVTISTYPSVKWIAKCGWYSVAGIQKSGWYFISIADKTILPVDQIDIKDITNESRSGGSVDVRPEPDNTVDHRAEFNYIKLPDSDTKLYPNDIVTLSNYLLARWVVKKGWYRIGTAQRNGWYFVNISDRAILPLEDINLTDITKEVEQGTTELRPTLKDIDTTPAESKFIVIPGTDIRLYDGDIVKMSNKPNIKWIAHTGWYIYDDVQNYGWYFVSIKNGEILPISIVDLTLCSLVTLKTQGSGVYDGKTVNYTRPFTVADAEILNRSFITLDTLEQRDNLDRKKLINGKMVRVNSDEGPAQYYAWNAETQTWEFLEVFGIPELVGLSQQPIILSELDAGLYRVKGTYKISPTYDMITLTPIDHIVFVADNGDIDIKVITESTITDYVVSGNDVIFVPCTMFF